MSTARLRGWLSKFAPVYPGEASAVGLCTAVNFFAVTGIMFGRNARDALFLVYFGIQYLPVMYFANAVGLVLCTVAYTWLVDRLPRGRFLAATSVLFVAVLVASRLVLFGHPRWFFPVLYIAAQVIWYFSLMQFWTFAGDLFDTRQAKRLYPLFAIGALLGMIGVGLFTRQVVRALGTENLFVLWAAAIAIATILGGIAFRRYRQAEPQDAHLLETLGKVKPSELQKIREGFSRVAHQPLLRSMAGYILLLWTVYAVVDFCFNKTMRAKYPDPGDLASFFGVFVGIQGASCLCIQLFLTRPVIARFGVGTTINFHPLALVLGTTWMSLSYGYTSVLATKLGDASMLYTFSDSSYQLLYSPISPDSRAQVRGFIEGYIRPLSLAAAGLLVLLGNSYLHPITLRSGRVISVGQELSWGAVALAAVWLSVALTTKQGYISALIVNLRGAGSALRDAAQNALRKLKQTTGVAAFVASLDNLNPEQAVAGILLLESFGKADSADALEKFLAHPDPRLRATAAKVIGRLDLPRFQTRLLPLLADSNPRVRANAVEALAASQSPDVVEKTRSLLDDSSSRVRINALIALAQKEGSEVVKARTGGLASLAHGNEDQRSAAAYAFAHLASPDAERHLLELLRDPSLRIRLAGAKGLGRMGTIESLPDLLGALRNEPILRQAARHSLEAIVARCGAACTRYLMQEVLATSAPEIRSELAYILGKMEGQEALPALVKLLQDRHWRVRWKVLKALERQAARGPVAPEEQNALFAEAEAELQSFRLSLDCSHALLLSPESESAKLLSRSLEEDRVRIEERVFHILGILRGREQMLSIFERLRSGDARQKADALEALDSLAPRKVSEAILPLLEPAPIPGQGKAYDRQGLFNSLLSNPKSWIRACAVWHADAWPDLIDAARIRALVDDEDRVVRESALYMGWKMYGARWAADLEKAAASPDVVLRRTGARIKQEDGLSPGPRTTSLAGGPLMLLTIEKVMVLKSASIFQDVDAEEVAALADVALEQDYQEGEVIFEQGQSPHHLYVIVKGKVEVLRKMDSTEHCVAVLGERECFGEMAILDDQPRSATIRAMQPTSVLKIDRESFRELLLERPQISLALIKMLSSRLRHSGFDTVNLSALDTGRHYA
jgi:ATP/ADP translocase/HEAT repeat protein